MGFYEAMPVKDYASFVLTVVLFLALPGPGNLAILSAYRIGGFRAAMVSTLGIAVGDQLLIVLALSGLAAILQEMPLVFKWIEYLGASYLIYMGWSMLRFKEGVQLDVMFKMDRVFRQSVGVTLLNPKAIFFYMAFFPLFLEKDRAIDFQVWALLAGTIAFLTVLYGVLLLFVLKTISKTVKDKSVWGKYLAKVLGILFIAFGIKLAFS
jgi:threonine/homoserine/homoserine lactone efflux protein